MTVIARYPYTALSAMASLSRTFRAVIPRSHQARRTFSRLSGRAISTREVPADVSLLYYFRPLNFERVSGKAGGNATREADFGNADTRDTVFSPSHPKTVEIFVARNENAARRTATNAGENGLEGRRND